MGWFDEQIKQRIDQDNELLDDAFMQLVGTVLGSSQSETMYNERTLTENALEEILKYYHLKIKEIPTKIQGLNEQLEWVLRPNGVMRRRIFLKNGWYKDAVGAMLCFTAEEHMAVAVIPGKLGGYYFTHPKTGVKTKVGKDHDDFFEREAICFYTPFPLKKLEIRDVLLHILHQLSVSDLISIAVVTGIVTLIGMLMPMLNRILFSDVVESRNLRVLAAIAIFMICTTVSASMFDTIRFLITGRIQTKINLNIEAAGMMRILQMPADFFKNYSSGELSQKVGQLNALASVLLNLVLSLGFTSVFSLFYIFQILAYTPGLVIPALMITFVTLAFSAVSTLVQMKYTKMEMEAAAGTSSMSYAILTGMQKIRLAGAEKRIFSRWATIFAREAAFSYNPPMFLKINPVITAAIPLVGTFILYGAAIRSHVSLADFYGFTTAYAIMSAAFMQITGVALTAAQMKPILDMVRPLMENVPEISEEKEIVTTITGNIELNHVSFRYTESMPNVIDDLSLKIKAGQYVAICGTTGCGKSTLVRLLLGFEEPQRGSIYYDGKDMTKLDLRSLRRNIGCVMQNGSLFQGDIFSNIVVSAPWLSMEDAWEAAALAGMKEDIESMPMGMSTLISEGQGGISGGQKQRIMIARAVANKPKLLIFDEATSALDNITQKKVSESLDSLKCTRIVVAHRLSTIRQCDRIIVLDKGHIIEDGTYDELITQKGFFAELVERQRVNQ